MTTNNDNQQSKRHELAIKLIKEGYFLFPVKHDKTPAVKSWLEYTTRKPTDEELSTWFVENDYMVAVPTGECNGITVIDFDKGNQHKDLFDALLKQSNDCYYQTRNYGYHIWFKYTDKLRTRAPIKGLEKVDCRNDGGYVVYYANNVIEKVNLQECPTDKFATQDEVGTKTDWSKIIDRKNPKGTRNDALCSIAGKLLSTLPQSDWETAGWELFKSYDLADNEPPLQEEYGIDDIRKKWDSLVNKELDKRAKGKVNNMNEGKKGSQANKIIEIVNEMIAVGDVVLFKDESKTPYIRIKMNNHFEIHKLKQVKQLFGKLYFDKNKEVANSESINTALNTIEGIALYEGQEYKLENRVIRVGESIFYDLTDSAHRAVKITKDGWEIITDTPILFKNYSHQKAQAKPVKGGDVKNILKFINVKDKSQEILILVFLVSCFIPEIPHTILNVYGTQGSAKSSLLRLLKKIIDPSIMELTSLTKDKKEFIQLLAHHWFIPFDNVSFLDEATSDILCRSTSGDAFSKRGLYTDDDDVIYSHKRCIAINGINLVATKPDLLERSILIELDRIPEDKRKEEVELINKFEKEISGIVGNVFDVVSRAMAIKPTIKLSTNERMADFVVWGCAIAEALGYSQDEFLSAYHLNTTTQNDEAINADIVGNLIIKLMKQESLWEGTATQLLSKLEIVAKNNAIWVTQHKDFPKLANALTRKINNLKTNLEQIGIKITIGKGSERFIKIEKITRSINDNINNVYKNLVNNENCLNKNESVNNGAKDSVLRFI